MVRCSQQPCLNSLTCLHDEGDRRNGWPSLAWQRRRPRRRAFLLSTSFPRNLEEPPGYGSQFHMDILLNLKRDTSSVLAQGEDPVENKRTREREKEILSFHHIHKRNQIIHEQIISDPVKGLKRKNLQFEERKGRLHLPLRKKRSNNTCGLLMKTDSANDSFIASFLLSPPNQTVFIFAIYFSFNFSFWSFHFFSPLLLNLYIYVVACYLLRISGIRLIWCSSSRTANHIVIWSCPTGTVRKTSAQTDKRPARVKGRNKWAE